MKPILAYVSLLAILTLALLPGCGGGKSSVPSVTARPKQAPKKTIDPDKTKTKTTDSGPRSGPGSFTGVVQFDGAAPAVGAPAAFNPGDPKTDKACVANKGKVKDLLLQVDPTSKGVKDVFVYVYKTKVDLPATAAPKTPVIFDQNDCTFLNPALIVRVGQPVEVRNSDQTTHNAHTNPLNAATQAYNKALSPGQKDTYMFGGAEKLPVKVVCDLHNWMVAYQLPLDHGFAALTDKDGKFKIDGLPEGEYTMRVYHAKAGYLEREFKVFVEAGKPTEEKFKYPAAKFASFSGPQPKTIVLSFNK